MSLDRHQSDILKLLASQVHLGAEKITNNMKPFV